MVNRRYQTSGWDYSMYLGWFTDAVTRAMFEKCLALLKEQEKSGKTRENRRGENVRAGFLPRTMAHTIQPGSAILVTPT